MSESFESQSWYRVAHLQPRLAERAEISRQLFRGVPWFVVRDPVTGRFTRLSESAYAVVSLMDGRRRLGEIWDIACAELGDDAPAQDELLATVTQMNALDLLQTDALPDADSLMQRGTRLRRRGLLTRFLNPLAVRVPLFDPDGLIRELWPAARPFFTVFGAVAYVLLLLAGAITAARHWEDLTGNLIDRVLTAESLALLVLVYPAVKALHELGHGFAVKKWGGEVREVGVMFLVFIPVPYVDASAATAYPSKWARVLVGAAGILVEIGLAAVAVLVWTELEEGFWRAVCFNVMLIGGLSTLFFNGNPLLRFDGYYVLSDLIEIPNLGPRSNRYLGYLIQRYLFAIEKARSPLRVRSEAPWLVFYAIASFCYRLFISIAIIMLVATKFFVVGVLLAIWAMSLMFVLPLVKHLGFLLFGQQLRGKRVRALAIASVCLGVVGGGLTLVPVPYRTVAEGVVHAPDHTAIYAAEAGRIAEVLVQANAHVDAATPLMRLSDPYAETELDAARADARRFALRYQQALSQSAFDVRLWRAQAARAESEATIVAERIESLVLRSPQSGLLVLPNRDDLEGRYLQKGEIIGHVVDPAQLVVRVAVPQDAADLIRRRTRSILIRPAEAPDRIVPARIVREVPAIGGNLASLALSTEGGGRFALDPAANGGPRSLEPVMHLDLAPVGPPPSTALGMRVYARFDHGSEPLAARIVRQVRQLFLKRFNV